jgi:hypothetical protein
MLAKFWETLQNNCTFSYAQNPALFAGGPRSNMDKQLVGIQTIKPVRTDADFQARHRGKPKYFPRPRVLTFSIVLALLLQKRVNSFPLGRNEFFSHLSVVVSWTGLPVTNRAFSQARQKLSPPAFSDLHRPAIVEPSSADSHDQTWQGVRLVAVAGSKIRLPDTPEIRREFGPMRGANQHTAELGEQPWALASVGDDGRTEIPREAI